MKFELTVLGSNSAVPGPDRITSAQILNVHDQLYMIDCGEGAQMKMSEYGIKRSRIAAIFISHLHGDHIFGLPGLLYSYQLQGREAPLKLFGPYGLRLYIEHIQEVTEGTLSFPIEYFEFGPSKYQRIYSDKAVEVFAFPLAHRIPTAGYVFIEKRDRLQLIKEAISGLNLSIQQLRDLKRGENIQLESGQIIENKELTVSGKKARKFAYCSDTKFDVSILPYVTAVDLLYHEATYMDDLRAIAHDRMHSTSIEAAMMAKKAGVGRLIIGHYSSRYRDLIPLRDEARTVFKNTELAIGNSRFAVEEKD